MEFTTEEIKLMNRLLVIERFKVSHTTLNPKSDVETKRRVDEIDELFKKINNEE